MSKKKMLLVFLIIAGFFYIGFFILKHLSKVIPSRSFTIWWPAYDAFQIRVQTREKIKQYIQTTFLQKQNIFLVLNEFQRKKADTALLTIYRAILAASRAPPVKIVLLLDYTIGSNHAAAKKNVNSLFEKNNRGRFLL